MDDANAAFAVPFKEWLDTEVSRRYLGATIGINVFAPLAASLLLLVGIAAFGCRQTCLHGKGQPPRARKTVLVSGVAATALLAYSGIALSVSLLTSGDAA